MAVAIFPDLEESLPLVPHNIIFGTAGFAGRDFLDPGPGGRGPLTVDPPTGGPSQETELQDSKNAILSFIGRLGTGITELSKRFSAAAESTLQGAVAAVVDQVRTKEEAAEQMGLLSPGLTPILLAATILLVGLWLLR